MRALLIVACVLLGSVAQAQAPTLAGALKEAQANLTRRAAALQASEVYKDYEAAKAHVETLTALVKADEATKVEAK
jgi:hypothetical protein